jgi:cold shock CspA family protein
MDIMVALSHLLHSFSANEIERELIAQSVADREKDKFRGEVKWFSDEKGYGYISFFESGIEKTAYFSVRDVQVAYLPERGDDVSFRIRSGLQGAEAYDIAYIVYGPAPNKWLDRLSFGVLLFPAFLIGIGLLIAPAPVWLGGIVFALASYQRSYYGWIIEDGIRRSRR